MMPGTMEYYDKAAAEWAERGYACLEKLCFCEKRLLIG